MTTASHRSYTYDPTLLIVRLLWPLLLANGLLWLFYARVPFMASVWFLMMLGTIWYMRRNG